MTGKYVFGKNGVVSTLAATDKVASRKKKSKSRSSSRGNVLSPFEFAAAGIEIASRCSEGVGRHGGRKLIDLDILRLKADGDEIDNEERINAYHKSSFRRLDEFSKDEESSFRSSGHDFRDSICPEACGCPDGKSCIVCCTSRDLMAYPALLTDRRVSRLPIPGKINEFSVRMPIVLAEALGLV
jgi:hypothetical protein